VLTFGAKSKQLVSLADENVATANVPTDFQLAEHAAKYSEEAKKSTTAAFSTFPIPRGCVILTRHIFFQSQIIRILAMSKRYIVLASNFLSVTFISQLDYASSMCAVMERFGQPGFADELDG